MLKQLPVFLWLTATAMAMPEVRGEVEKGKCENGPGAAGADETYIGSFKVEGTTVTGTETRVLYANEKWKKSKNELGEVGGDCEVTWKLEGERIDPLGCTTCDFGIKVQADADFAKSTCHKGLYTDALHQTLSYDVKKAEDGTLTLHFHKSGKKLGRGYHDGKNFSYITPHRCNWF